MKFRTEIFPDSPPFYTDLDKGALLIGSCFSDYMAERLRQTLWDICPNPCGTLFNPASIARLLQLACGDREMREAEIEDSLFFHAGLWRSFLLPTEFASPAKEDCRDRVSTAIDRLRAALIGAGIMFVTFGTANVYALADLPGYIVTNCHKLPAKSFVRIMMEIDDIVERWQATLTHIHTLNPDLKIIFTVSPVRHVRDGYHENTLSKSTLHLAVDRLCRSDAGCWYFPAYELVTDDLRDYRFYDTDLVHPSETAVDYIKEKLLTSCFTPDQQKVLQQGEELWRRLNHHPFHPDSPEAVAFREETGRITEIFLATHPAFRL